MAAVVQPSAAAPPQLTQHDLPQLLQLLQAALNSDSTQQKAAEGLLASLETRPGFCSCLTAIVANSDCDHSARWLASVHLKNCVSKYWRTRGTGGVTAEEKQHLRQAFLELIPQQDNQIAVQVALVFAKAARHDFPREWPDLFTALLSQLPGAAPQRVRRTYFVLHHILKELSTKRLVADQKHFAEITQLLWEHIWSTWCADLAPIVSCLPSSSRSSDAAGSQAAAHWTPAQQQQLLLHFERWLLLLKILRRLVLFGFPSDARSLQPVPAVNLVAPALLEALRALQPAAPAANLPSAAITAGPAPPGHTAVTLAQLAAMADRAVLKLVKTLRQIQDVHPWSFQAAGVLVPSMDWCCQQLVEANDGGESSSSGSRARLLVQCGLLLLGVVQCPGYQGKTGSIQATEADKQRAQLVKTMGTQVTEQLQGFWQTATPLPAALQQQLALLQHGSPQQQQQQQQPRVAVLITALLLQHLPLTARELKEWEDDAEAFYHAADTTSSWQDSPRGCAEQLVLVLVVKMEALVPLLVQYLAAAASSCPPGAAPAALPGPRVGPGQVPRLLLLKEALYRAAATSSFQLAPAVDYSSWLKSSLVQELTQVTPHTKPLAWAAAKVVAAWVPSLKPEERPMMYQALTHLLQHEDLCLKLTALSALRALVDDFGFAAGDLVPCLPPLVQECTRLLCESAELDTQTQVFTLLNLLLETMGPELRPQVGLLLAALPHIWQGAAGQSLLRIQVLSCMQLLVHFLDEDSPAAYDLVLPMLTHALDVAHNGEPELQEDGLLLWLVTVRAALAPHPQLMELTHFLVPALLGSTEYIALGMQLFSSLLLLGGAPYLAQWGPGLAEVLVGYLGNVKARGMLLMLPVMDQVLVCSPQEGAAVLAAPLQKLLALVVAGSETNQVVGQSMCVFSRLVVLNPGAFHNLVAALAAGGVAPPSSYTLNPQDPPAERLLGYILALFTEHFDVIAQPLARLLCAAGLAACLRLRCRIALAYLTETLDHVTGVWRNLQTLRASGDEDYVYESPLFNAGNSDEDNMGGLAVARSVEAAGESRRRAALQQHEPLRQLHLASWVRAALEDAAATHPQEFAAAMAGVHEAIRGELHAMMQSIAGGAAAGAGGAGQPAQ